MCLLKPVLGLKKETFSAKGDFCCPKCTEGGGGGRGVPHLDDNSKHQHDYGYFQTF